jgi:hypothetical protein
VEQKKQGERGGKNKKFLFFRPLSIRVLSEVRVNKTIDNQLFSRRAALIHPSR